MRISAVLGSGPKEGTIGKDTGEGIEEMTDEQILEWKDILSPEEFDDMFKDYDLSDLIDTTSISC